MSPMDRSPPHLPTTVTLLLPAYFPIFPSSRLVILFTRIPVAVNFDGDKHFGLVYIGVRTLKGNKTGEATSAPIFTFHGVSFCRLTTMLEHSHMFGSRLDFQQVPTQIVRVFACLSVGLYLAVNGIMHITSRAIYCTLLWFLWAKLVLNFGPMWTKNQDAH
jgi:hypothetical protein